MATDMTLQQGWVVLDVLESCKEWQYHKLASNDLNKYLCAFWPAARVSTVRQPSGT